MKIKRDEILYPKVPFFYLYFFSKVSYIIHFKKVVWRLCVWVFYMHLTLCTMCVQGLWSPEEGVRSPGAVVIDYC